MKKILVASTALVAASLFSAGAASASEKIKLELGGYSKWWVVGAWQDNSFQANNNTQGAQGDYNNVDVKGDNEIFFEGSTTLNNGVQVGIHVELEAGGTTDNTADTIDKSNVFIAGGFGKFIIGSEDNGAYLLHVMAPDAAGNTDVDGILTGGLAIAKPGSFNYKVTTGIDTDGAEEKITYVAPTFYGLTVGATYAPNTKEDDRGATKINNNNSVIAADVYGVGALYANTFGGVGVKVSAGFATYTVESNGSAAVLGKSGVDEYSVGTQLSYAGFTLGGSYRQANADQILQTAGLDAKVWDAGLMYESGPYAVSFMYFNSKADSASVANQDDEFTVYQVSGKYTLGAGVDALASVGHAEYDSASTSKANSNKGWAVMTGLSLAF